MNLVVTNVINWMRNNKLSVNFAKTEYMIVTKKKLDKHLKFEIKKDNHVISKKECIKYLGALIDNNLDWKHHNKQVCKKISSGAWAIARLRNYVFRKLHCLFFWFFFRSKIALFIFLVASFQTKINSHSLSLSLSIGLLVRLSQFIIR